MPNTRIGPNRWVPDIRPDKVTTFEDGEDQCKAVEVHPILNKVLNGLAYFKTHAKAVIMDRATGKTVHTAITDLEAKETNSAATITSLSAQVTSISSQVSTNTSNIAINSNNIAKKYNTTGGTLTGNVTVHSGTATSNGFDANYKGTFNIGNVTAGDKAAIWTDSEGGTIEITSPNGTKYQFDAYNGNLRIWNYGAGSSGMTPLTIAKGTGLATLVNLILSGQTGDRVLLLNGSKQIVSSGITSTQLSYLSGLTGNIQSQINELSARIDKCLPLTGGTISGNLNVTGSFSAHGIEIYGSVPYIDFHYNTTIEDYDVRIINSNHGVLEVLNSDGQHDRIL